MNMETRYSNHFDDVKHYDTEKLREHFLVEKIFIKDTVKLVYSHNDRIIFGGIMPVEKTLKLEGGKELASDYFLQRRELGIINIGGEGSITIDNKEYKLSYQDGLYVGMGAKNIEFKAIDKINPPKFYICSATAHTSYPTVFIDITKANKRDVGSLEDCNKRVINQYIHPDVLKSCQLAMGMTVLAEGSNWNTMPSHTHERRMEVYFYFDMEEETVVFHMMGKPEETRHIVMQNEQAVISPSWSIHSGVGTKRYAFIWGMVGENQDFDDMDHFKTSMLK